MIAAEIIYVTLGAHEEYRARAFDALAESRRRLDRASATDRFWRSSRLPRLP
jgi:hypothetical protein